jgi:hypothetical protein
MFFLLFSQPQCLSRPFSVLGMMLDRKTKRIHLWSFSVLVLFLSRNSTSTLFFCSHSSQKCLMKTFWVSATKKQSWFRCGFSIDIQIIRPKFGGEWENHTVLKKITPQVTYQLHKKEKSSIWKNLVEYQFNQGLNLAPLIMGLANILWFLMQCTACRYTGNNWWIWSWESKQTNPDGGTPT